MTGEAVAYGITSSHLQIALYICVNCRTEQATVNYFICTRTQWYAPWNSTQDLLHVRLLSYLQGYRCYKNNAFSFKADKSRKH